MNISCAICSDLYVASSIIYATQCGHIFHHVCLEQWLERSPTCPECRNRCSGKKSTFRIFTNVSANLDDSHLDVATLSNRVDTLSSDLREKDAAIKKHADKEQKWKTDLKKSSKVIKELEDQSKKKEAIILSYMAEVCTLRSECKRIELLQRENEDLKSKIEMMATINSLLTSTSAEVDDILSKDLDTKTLAVTVASLRRELKASDYRKNQLRKVLTGYQNDLRNESALRKHVEEKLSVVDSENYQLKQTVDALRAGQASLEDNAGTRDANTSTRGSLKRSFTETTDSPSIPEKVQKIIDATSPYLNIKSSSVGLSPLFSLKSSASVKSGSVVAQSTTNAVSTTEVTKPKFSIFQSSRLTTKTTICKSKNLVFNGLGGSERKEAFPEFPNRFDVAPRKPLNEKNPVTESKFTVKRSKMDKLSRPPTAPSGPLAKYLQKSPAKHTQ